MTKPRTAAWRRLLGSGFVLITAGLSILIATWVGRGDLAASRRSLAELSEAGVDLVWPAAPETSRIRYLFTITTPQELGIKKSFFRKLGEFFRGSKGEEDGLRQPYGIAVDPEGRIYVADAALRVVHVFDIPKGKYRSIRGTKDAEFQVPIGVALDTEGRLYVSDAGRHVVIGFNAGGKAFLEISDGLERPTGLVFNPQDSLLYVADTWLHTVFAYDLQGRRRFTIGGRGAEEGRFNFPTNIAVDARGDLYVTDAMNFRVQVIRPGGTVVRKIGRHGDAIGDFAGPKGIGVDSDGHLYVVEGLYDVVNVFDADGRFLLTFGGPGTGRGEFWLATGLFVDREDRIYVADSFNGRVEVFQYLRESR